MTSKQKSIMAEEKAAIAAYREKYGGKPTEPYYDHGKFVNAHIDGSWPIDIFLNGFYHGVDYANTDYSVKRRVVKRRKKK